MDRHRPAPRHADANARPHRDEAELDPRDPETMRDYRSWRNARGAPGQAMQKALAERNVRLSQAVEPLTAAGATTMGTDEVLTGGPLRTRPRHPADRAGQTPRTGAKAGEALLRRTGPNPGGRLKAMRAERPAH